MDGANTVKLYLNDERNQRQIYLGKIRLYQQFGQYVMITEIDRRKIKKLDKKIAKRETIAKIIAKLHTIFSDFGDVYYPNS